jgi:hypothetical protein
MKSNTDRASQPSNLINGSAIGILLDPLTNHDELD